MFKAKGTTDCVLVSTQNVEKCYQIFIIQKKLLKLSNFLPCISSFPDAAGSSISVSSSPVHGPFSCYANRIKVKLWQQENRRLSNNDMPQVFAVYNYHHLVYKKKSYEKKS